VIEILSNEELEEQVCGKLLKISEAIFKYHADDLHETVELETIRIEKHHAYIDVYVKTIVGVKRLFAISGMGMLYINKDFLTFLPHLLKEYNLVLERQPEFAANNARFLIEIYEQLKNV